MVITRCLMVHFGVSAVRTAWSSLINASVGRSLAYEVVAIAALELACAVLWRQAKPGHARESLPLLKAFNLAQMAIATLQFLYIFEYYVADLRELPDMGAVAARRLAAEGFLVGGHGGGAAAAATETLRGFTLFLDLTLMLFALFGSRTAHVLIVDKMQAQKAREMKRAGAGAARPESTSGLAAFAPRQAQQQAAAGNGGAAAAAEAAAVVAAKASERTRARRRHA
jgi:hypothetical protein